MTNSHTEWTCTRLIPAIVEPNQYNEKDIGLQTEYFHEESLLEKKRSLPEEQKALTFEPEKYNFYETVERTFSIIILGKQYNSGQSRSIGNFHF